MCRRNLPTAVAAVFSVDASSNTEPATGVTGSVIESLIQVGRTMINFCHPVKAYFFPKIGFVPTSVVAVSMVVKVLRPSVIAACTVT